MTAGDFDNDELRYNKEIFRKIGIRLKTLRKAKGYTNYEKFANAFDISRSNYGKYERGVVNLTMETLLKILRALDVSLGEFFSEGFD